MAPTEDCVLLRMQPHTQAKHGLLRRYLDAWYPILGTTHGRLLFVDGFAGPGRYVGGEPGSPVIALERLLKHKAIDSILRPGSQALFKFIEERADRCEHLQEEIDKFARRSGVSVEVMHGTFEAHFRAVLSLLNQVATPRTPALVFIDPFGPTGFPMTLVSELAAHPSTEVLINFAYQSLNQFFIRDASKRARVDELFGGDDWRPALKINKPATCQTFLVNTYMRALANHGWDGVAFRMMSVVNQPLYYLVFGTKNRLGKRHFKRAAWHVSPDGTFSYSDFYDPRQLRFENVTDELVISRLAEELIASFAGRPVPRSELEEFADWHPVALPTHLTGALRDLQDRKPPLIEKVMRSDGTQARRHAFPPESTVHFAAQGSMGL